MKPHCDWPFENVIHSVLSYTFTLHLPRSCTKNAFSQYATIIQSSAIIWATVLGHANSFVICMIYNE